MSGPEDVANARAWNELQGAAAHPYSKGHLEILAAPHLQGEIVTYSIKNSPWLGYASNSRHTHGQSVPPCLRLDRANDETRMHDCFVLP